MVSRNRFLTLFLRLIGTVAGTAAVCAMMPFRWMDYVHQTLGMGVLPDSTIVAYLARSTAAFYALLGGLLWALSFDLTRYRPVIRWVGIAIIGMGVFLFWVDWDAGLPGFWRTGEGPIDIVLGSIILWASRTTLSGNGGISGDLTA